MEKYKEIVKKIKNLNWDSLSEEDLQKMMILSAYSAVEFAESLRITLEHNDSNEALKEMAEEELKTDTLSFGDYDIKGDHSEFLWHFIKKYGLMEKYGSMKEAGEEYIEKVKRLSPKVRIMSIVSREQELPEIFKEILSAKSWDAEGLPEYKYYMDEHIELDSGEEGHAEKLKEFVIDESVAEFYAIRLEMYKSIPKLFE